MSLGETKNFATHKHFSVNTKGLEGFNNMTATPSLDLDPLFIRALRLLHSKSKDSTEQLKQMLDDVLQQRTSGHTTPTTGKMISNLSSTVLTKKLESSREKLMSSSLRKSSPKHLVDVDFFSLKKSDDKKTEKRGLDKVKFDMVDSIHDSKRTKFDSPPQLKIEVKKEEPEEALDGPDFENTDADHFAMEMGLACVVCRNIEVSSGNQLIECQECHNLYHQECHKPAITDQDVNDPRLVWYCAKCAKNIKKLTSKSQKTGKSSPAGMAKEIIVTKPLKTESNSLPSTTQLFKRSEVKSPAGTSTPNTRSTNPGNKPTGLAGLAATLSGRSSANKTPPPGNGGIKNLNTKSSAALPNLSKISASCNTKRDLVFSNLSSSIKNSSNSGSNSGSRSQSSSSSKASSSSSNNGSSKSAPVLPLSADKRLQIMKKKAEKKLNEKRWKN